MFVFSFKASKIKLIGIVFICIALAALIIAFLPDAGSSMNVNKIDSSERLLKIDAGKEKGRMEYFAELGYSVKKDPVSKTSEKLAKKFDAVMERYNDLQRSQGYDLEKYKGKSVTGYTYEVLSLPDKTRMGDEKYFATIIVHNDKVVAADLCCPETNEYYPLVRLT